MTAGREVRRRYRDLTWEHAGFGAAAVGAQRAHAAESLVRLHHDGSRVLTRRQRPARYGCGRISTGSSSATFRGGAPTGVAMRATPDDAAIVIGCRRRHVGVLRRALQAQRRREPAGRAERGCLTSRNRGRRGIRIAAGTVGRSVPHLRSPRRQGRAKHWACATRRRKRSNDVTLR